MRCVAILTLAALPLCASMLVSCGDRFEPPCRVTARDVVVTGPATPLDALALSEGAGGDVVVLALVSASANLDADAAAGATLVVPAAVVAVIGSGGPRLVHTYEPPAGLRARHGSTGAIGATFAAEGVLFYWTETSITTAADGTRISSSVARRQRVELDGRDGPLVDDADLACGDCTISTVYESLGPTTVAILRQVPDVGPETTRLVAFDGQGRKKASIDLASLLGRVDLAPPSMKLYARAGQLVATLGRRAATFDAALTLREGPWTLPDRAAEIDPASGALASAWVGSLDALAGVATEAGAAATRDGELGDLIVAQPSRATRITTSSRVLLVRRNADRLGVLHSLEKTRYFSLVAGDGTKRGGDLPLGPLRGGDLPLGPLRAGRGPVDPATRSHLVLPVDRTHFVVWSGEDNVTRETITCDP